MKRFLLSILLTLSLLASSCTASNLKPTQHAAMHRLLFQTKTDGSYCTGYAISPHAVLTAAHCDERDMTVVFDKDYNDKTAVVYTIDQKYFDDEDHMIFVVKAVTFTDFIKYDPATYKPPEQGEHIYFWGNPERRVDIYREGYIAGQEFEGDPDIKGKSNSVLVMSTCGHGDSGAAVFAEDGRIVLLVTGGFSSVIMYGYPLAFTPQQVAEATK